MNNALCPSHWEGSSYYTGADPGNQSWGATGSQGKFPTQAALRNSHAYGQFGGTGMYLIIAGCPTPKKRLIKEV